MQCTIVIYKYNLIVYIRLFNCITHGISKALDFLIY